MARPVTISLVSLPTYPPDEPDRLAKTLRRMESFVDEAARRQSALVAFPETCNTLHSGPTWAEAEAPDGPTLSAMRGKAVEHGIYVVCPLILEEHGTRQNSAVLIGRDGEMAGVYRKNFLTHEELDEGIIPGTETPVFETDFGKLGLAICFDIFFLEVGAGLAAEGAELVLWPSMPPGGRLLCRWPTEFGFHLGAITSNRSTFVDVAGREIEMRRGSVYGATGGGMPPLTTATLDLDHRLLCHDYNLARIQEVCEKYGSHNLHVEWIQAECLVIFGSLMPDISTDELIEAFGIETMRDYIARARRSRKQALRGTYLTV
jgi:hypothetical protein